MKNSSTNPGHIIYHIGLHKTGTTSIQEFCHNNRNLLLEHGIDYPLLGLRSSGCRAHTHFADYTRGIVSAYPFTLQEDVAAWTPERSRVLISCEDFYYIAKCTNPPEAIARLRELMPSESSEAVAFIRRPDNHIRSIFGEEVSAPSTVCTFEAFIEQQTQALLSEERFTYYRFEKNLQPWHEIGKLSILEYESRDAVGGLLKHIELEDLNSKQPDESQLNASLPFEVNTLRVTANQLLSSRQIDAQQRKAVHRLLRNVDLSRLSRLCNTDIRALFQPTEIDFRAFRAAFLAANNQRFYPESIPDSIVVPALRNPEADSHKALVSHLANFRLTKKGTIEALI